MSFETDQHNTMTITVPNADPGVRDADVAGAMQRIIRADAVTTSAGKPAFAKKAALVLTETTDYDLL